MTELDHVTAGLEEIGTLLDAQHLDPDPSRKDWDDHGQTLSTVTARLETEVLGPLPTALAGMEEQDRIQLQLNAAFLAAEVAALLHAAGRHDEAMSLIGRALTHATGDPELEGAMADMHGYALLTRARWLYRHKKSSASDSAFKRAEKEARADAIKVAAKRGYDAPRPISSAPPLFRINGCGFGLYGARDQWPDGSHVATYCISLIFIPVFPLTAYRIVDHGDNSYAFLAKERLSGFARGYRNLLAACVALFIVFTGVAGYLESPERRARVAIEEAQQLEASGDRAGALERYLTVVTDHGWSSNGAGDEAARAIVRIESAAGAGAAEGLAARFRGFPEPVRSGIAGEDFGAQLESWADGEKDRRAALRLLAHAEVSSSATARVAAKRAELQVALAGELAPLWPISALELYLDARAQEQAGAILDRLVEHPSLLAANRRLVELWLAGGGANAEAVRAALDQALAMDADPERRALLEKGGLKRLLARAKSNPADQEVAVAIASIHRSRGKSKLALKALSKIGEPGWMIPNAQQQLGSLYLDLGELEKSEGILDPYLSSRLPRFAAARQKYSATVKTFREGLVNRAKFGTLPADLEAKLNGASQDDQSRIFFEWVTEQEAKDPELLALRGEYEAYGDVVPASVTLGMVKLRRAGDATGEERARLLARAEEVFLAIRAEAEGLPMYHLGLGQVYHRLGRAEEGDRELAGVLQQNDPYLSAAVSRVYRELGLIKQAREVAQRVFDSSSGPARDEAALMMSLMSSTLDEERAWLLKANGKDKFVAAKLEEVEARVLYRDGKYREADKLFAKVAAAYQKDAAHNSAAANNAALAYQRRYLCTGDERFLQSAVKGLEAALRLEPDNTLVLSNLAYQYQHQGEVDVIGAWIDTSILPLDSGQSSSVLRALARGALKDQVVERVQENGALTRSLNLSRQEEVLAPERTDSYLRALSRGELLRDEDFLKALGVRVANLGRVDTTQAEEALESYKRGDQDGQMLAAIDSDLERLDRALKAAKRKKSRPTIAAIQILRGGELESRSMLTSEVKDARRALAAFESAEQAWDGVAVTKDRVAALMRVALLEAKGSSPALASLWAKDGRELGVSLVLYEAATAPNAAEMLASLRAQDALADAVTAAKSMDPAELRVAEWILAKVAGDAELEGRAKGVFARSIERLQNELATKLSPSSRALAMTKSLFDQGG